LERLEDTASVKTVTSAIKKHKKQQLKRRIGLFFRRLLIVVICGLLGFGLYKLDQSMMFRVVTITVSGNHYVSDQEIIELSTLSKGQRTWLIHEFFIQPKIEGNPWIQSASIIVKDKIASLIIVENRPIGYQVSDSISILLPTGMAIEINEQQRDWIATLPIIIGFKDELLRKKLGKAFSLIDDHVMMFIAEIHQSAVSYDAALLMIVMQDGHRVFSDFSNLEMLNDYHLIASQLKPENKCIIFLDIKSRAISSRPCDDD